MKTPKQIAAEEQLYEAAMAWKAARAAFCAALEEQRCCSEKMQEAQNNYEDTKTNP